MKLKKKLCQVPMALALLWFAVFGAETKTVAAVSYTNEFWISTNATALMYVPGINSTITTPFDGSTPENFDTNMNAFPAFSTIHIMAGTYLTYGSGSPGCYGYAIKPGQKILGSGMDVTILKLANPTNTSNGICAMIGRSGGSNGPDTNDEISDLTIDLNYGNNGSYNVGGISLAGSQNAVRRVKVIHAYCAATASDSYCILLGNYGIPSSHGNIVEECEVSDPSTVPGHNAIDGIDITGTSGIIRDNRVVFPCGLWSFGINGEGSHDCLVEGNYLAGAAEGIHIDTGGATNITYVNNTIIACSTAASFSGGEQFSHLTFAFNTVDITNVYGPAYGFAFSGGTFTNITIFGNKVADMSVNRTVPDYFVSAGNVTGFVAANNSIDSGLTNDFWSNANLYIYNNTDLYGKYLQQFNNTEMNFDYGTITSDGDGDINLTNSVSQAIYWASNSAAKYYIGQDQSEPGVSVTAQAKNTSVHADLADGYARLVCQTNTGAILSEISCDTEGGIILQNDVGGGYLVLNTGQGDIDLVNGSNNGMHLDGTGYAYFDQSVWFLDGNAGITNDTAGHSGSTLMLNAQDNGQPMYIHVTSSGTITATTSP